MFFRFVVRHGPSCRFTAAAAGATAASTIHQSLPVRMEWSQSWNWYPNGKDVSTTIYGPRVTGPPALADEPLFSRSEIAAHDGSRDGGKIWVTYRDGVYDVTNYLHEHPGGKFILQAAGGPVDGFWKHWGQHHMSEKVVDALQRLRIGRVEDPETLEKDDERYGLGAWEDEQKDSCRIENRKVTSRYCEMPYVSETSANALVGKFLTPNTAFYVRNHAPVPFVDPQEADEHPITFCCGEDEVATFTLKELRTQFPPQSCVSIMQCSGNRGSDNIAANGFQKSGFVDGTYEHIGLGLLGNAAWKGVALPAVLRHLFPSALSGNCRDLHVTFEGLDGYSTSTPLSYIMDPANNCMLATDMNETHLPADHGFPVRALLPGITGARHVKWVSRISIGSECDSPWNQMYYKDKPSQESLQRLPMNSVILSPEPGEAISAEAVVVPVTGVAYGGGTGSRIAGVEVSVNRGRTWQQATCIEDVAADDPTTLHSWVRFCSKVEIPAAGGGHGALGYGGPLVEIWCRARCDSGEEQPPVSGAHGGYFYNGYHRVPLVRRRAS